MTKVEIRQTKSEINCPKRQKATLSALGLRRVNGVVTHELTPQIRGMLNRVGHLVSIELIR